MRFYADDYVEGQRYAWSDSLYVAKHADHQRNIVNKNHQSWTNFLSISRSSKVI